MQNLKIKNSISVIIVCCFLFMVLLNFRTVIYSVKDSMLLCYNTVIPALFIFMILSSFLSELPASEIISIPFMPFFNLLKIKNKKIVSYCILSVIGGFAMGGFFLNKICEETDEDKNLVTVLSILMSNNSPSFIILAVGVQMLGSFKNGLILYGCIILSSYITAFIFSFIYTYKDVEHEVKKSNNNTNITKAIKTSTNNLINICGVVIFACTLCNIIQLYTDNSLIILALSGITEVTTCCKYIFDFFSNNIYLYCIALSFLPLSSMLQIKSFLKNNSLNFKAVYYAKIIQTTLSVLFLRIIINLFPQTSSVYAPNNSIKINMYWNKPQISFCFLLISLCFAVFVDKQIKLFTINKK